MPNITDLQNLDPTVAIVFLVIVLVLAGIKFIEWLFPKNIKQNDTHPLCQNIITLETLFNTNLETQKETSKLIHNTLHTTDEQLKLQALALNNLITQVAILNTTINERMPKKQ